MDKVEKVETNDKNKKLLFVHIPKTGGVSICHQQDVPLTRIIHHFPRVDPCGTIQISLLHMLVLQPDFRDYESFTVIRCPIDRFVSAYAYLLQGGMQNSTDLKYQAVLLSYPTMDDVLQNLSELKTKIVHFVDQAAYVADDQDHILVDHVIRFENLREELEQLDPGFASLPHLNASSHPHIVLTPEQKRQLVEIYQRDFRVFKFPGGRQST